MNELPYTDAKPVGAADFYLAINATFRFVQNRFGMEGLRRYWHALGTSYFRPVAERWREGGLQAVASYWSSFFAAEPGADVEVEESPDAVVLHVRVCPLIAHLRSQGREVLPCLCQHCYFVSEAIGETSGVHVRIRGGNGSCTQRFTRGEELPQDLLAIESCAQPNN